MIAYAAGGALETVVPGTGHLFAEQSVPAMIDAVNAFDTTAVDPAFIRAHAQKFDADVFKRKMTDFVTEKVKVVGHRRAKRSMRVRNAL